MLGNFWEKLTGKAKDIEKVSASALKSGAKTISEKVDTVKNLGKKQPPKHKIFGVEVSDEMLRAIVLICMLAIFFILGMFFGAISAYHHMNERLHHFQMYNLQQDRFRRDSMMRDRITFPSGDQTQTQS